MSAAPTTTPSGFTAAMRSAKSQLAGVELVQVGDTLQFCSPAKPPRHLALIAALCGCFPVLIGWLIWFFAPSERRDSAGLAGSAFACSGLALGLVIAIAYSLIRRIDAARGPMVVIGPGDTVTLPRSNLTMSRGQISAIEHVRWQTPHGEDSLCCIVVACTLNSKTTPIEVCQLGSPAVKPAARLAEVLGVPLRECTITAEN